MHEYLLRTCEMIAILIKIVTLVCEIIYNNLRDNRLFIIIF